MDDKHCPYCGQKMGKEVQEKLRRKRKQERAMQEREEKKQKEFQEKIKNYPENKDGEIYDPKEKDPKYRDIIKKADKEAEETLKKKFPETEKQLGYCHLFWQEKKRILKEKYNIEWYSPDELNPLTLYD